MNFTTEELPSVNAALNALAAVLLMVGWTLIKLRHERSHKITMLSAFVVSIVFLTCYLVYHYRVGHVVFEGPPIAQLIYPWILWPHVILAATIPFLAGVTIFLGLTDRRQKHRQLARWTFPIWLYVSITGVVIYVMLYHLYPASGQTSIIDRSQAGPAVVLTGEAK